MSERSFNQWKLEVGLENIKRMEDRHCNFCLMCSGNFSFSPYLSEAKEKKYKIITELLGSESPKKHIIFFSNSSITRGTIEKL